MLASNQAALDIVQSGQGVKSLGLKHHDLGLIVTPYYPVETRQSRSPSAAQVTPADHFETLESAALPRLGQLAMVWLLVLSSMLLNYRPY
jgi:hypothetical protein